MSEPNGVIEILTLQTEQMTQLRDLLVQEKEVLTLHSPEKLNSITAQKQALLQQVESIDSALSANEEFVAQKASGTYQIQLDGLAALLHECQQLNQVNGAIIEKSNLAVERMKTTLLQQHSKSSMTYDSKGKTSGGLSSLGVKA